MSTPPIQSIRRLRGGRRLVDPLTVAADARRQDLLARSLRATRLFGSRPLPAFWSTGRPNFGDALSPAVLAYVSGLTPVLVSKRCRGKVLAAGSVLHRLEAHDTVWGTGSMYDSPIEPPPGVRFLAVRGPLTRSLIKDNVPEVYGDPALLLPRLIQPSIGDSRHPVGIVPHYLDYDVVSATDHGALLIDVRAPWQTVVDQINSCDVILSSSLHGIIVAEAYGIPAVWIKITDKIVGGSFKYRDYYLSTGREPPNAVHWMQGLLAMTSRAEPPPEIRTDPLVEAWRAHFPQIGNAFQPNRR